MKTHSKLFLIVFLVAITILGFFAYRIIVDRNSNPDLQSNEQKNSAENENLQSDDSSEASENLTEEELDKLEEEEESAIDTERDTFLQVLPEDCKNECKNYQEEEDVTYCKQVCGLTEIKKIQTGCDALSDLEKDYCIKDQAISKTDPKICDQIEDGKIEQICKNRILEDIVDAQMQQAN